MVSQYKYASNLLIKFNFNMADFKESPFQFLLGVSLEEVNSTPHVDSTLYRQLIGSLLY